MVSLTVEFKLFIIQTQVSVVLMFVMALFRDHRMIICHLMHVRENKGELKSSMT